MDYGQDSLYFLHADSGIIRSGSTFIRIVFLLDRVGEEHGYSFSKLTMYSSLAVELQACLIILNWDGSGDTVGNAWYDPANFKVAEGASGNPESEHNDDLFNVWAQDKAFPFLYSRKEIEKARFFLFESSKCIAVFWNIKGFGIKYI